MAFDALLYDGDSARRQAVTAVLFGDRVDINYDDGSTASVDARLLKRLESDPETLRLARTDRQGWRLILPDHARPELEALLGRGDRYGRWIDRVGLLPALIGFGCLAAATVAVGFAAPQWLAPHVPHSWERNLGSAIVGDFGENRCRSAEGQRALEALVERLEPGATRGEQAIQIAALDVSMFNAVALPGGHIVLFKGMLVDIEDPDALAGIVAHEIAHVRRRHVTEALIRELGIGALIRLFAGNIGANAEQLVALSYTREHEAEADAEAIAMLQRAGISPLATARLFERLAAEEGEEPGSDMEFLNSHPLSRARAHRFAAAHDEAATYRPALTVEQSDALFNMCWKGPAQ